MARAVLLAAIILASRLVVGGDSDHWAYQLPADRQPPPSVAGDWPATDVDRLILARLQRGLDARGPGLSPVEEASPETLVRRLHFDLVGLPPTPDEMDEYLADPSPEAWERLVDRLLGSPQFGERWGRHWLDVVRFAESVTLRGLVFHEAWRYRDYVIESFDRDVPFDQFLREQIAGDLLAAETPGTGGDALDERQRRLVATTVLMLGNTNFEEQDKQQLELDVIDEQLDLIGRGFLGQTITCARCHDHKFDPIPARDYYALAGILKNAQALEHENVSKWIERSIPLPPADEARHQEQERELAALESGLAAARDALKAAAGDRIAALGPDVLAAGDLPGILVDDTAARRVGQWQLSQHAKRYIGDGYLHDQDGDKGRKTLTFAPDLPATGRYEVRLAYTHGTNRSERTPVTVFSAEGEKTMNVNQREPPPIDGRFISLGQYRFEQGGQSFVIVSNSETTGHVIADAVQFLPLDSPAGDAATAAAPGEATGDTGEAERLRREAQRLEGELALRRKSALRRPSAMTVVEKAVPADLHIHLRGSVHNRGPVVPRGFLAAASPRGAPSIPASSGGRRELAEWVASRDNPLTARVFVNRVWNWLFGAGLVRTTDNFGTTGEAPSHPELLDHLALAFIEDGWSIKRLIRRIVTSRTYRLAVADDPQCRAADPDNRLLWRANRRRLDAECLRDAMLLAAGTLDLARGGPTFPADLAADYGHVADSPRRSVHLPVFRNALPELLETFDFADPNTVTGERTASTVAPQALFLMNHPFVVEQSRRTAERLIRESADDSEERLNRAYRLILGRQPTAPERRIAQRFLAAVGDTPETWWQLVQSLFATVEFRYIR